MISTRFCSSAGLCAAMILACVALAPTAALAQASKKGKAASSAKPAAKPVAKKPVVALVKGPAAADDEQIAAAQWVHYGNYDCEFNQKVEIAMNPTYAAYADVRFRKAVYLMKPVLSSTGAIRLEDVKGQTVMIQIANKSMLMDVKVGQRLVDDCVSQRQRELIEAARLQREQQTGDQPAPESLFRADPVPGAASAPASMSAPPPPPQAAPTFPVASPASAAETGSSKP